MAESAAVVDIRSLARAAGEKQYARIYLYGPMKIVSPGGENVLPRLRKTRALLAYLCLADGARVSRGRLIELLWARSGDAQARLSLRQALAELKSTVCTKVPGLIEIDREGVRLEGKACWIDALEGQGHGERLLEDLEGTSPAFDQWLEIQRTRFEDQQRTNLEEDLDRLIETNAPPRRRIEAARKLSSFDPTNEVAARSLMTAFVDMGERSQAIREYERCKHALKTLVDAAPSSATVALYEGIRLSRSPAAPANAISASPRVSPGDFAAPHADLPAAGAFQPSIAVLPFRNLTDVAAHNYASDGLVEDLIEVLSRIPNFFVISRLSTLGFRNHERAPQEIGEVLGVQYVLSGSMRVADDRLRLTVELTDARKGTALWSQRLEEKFFDLFEVQDRLVDAIVRRIAPYVRQAELSWTRVKRPERLDAYDLFLRAQENMHNSSRAVFETSERLFEEAIARHPTGYATAQAWLAYWHVLRVGQGWSPDPSRDTRLAERFAAQAIECDPTEPMALAVDGHIVSYLHKNFDVAFRRFTKALDINPNAAPALLWRALAHAWIGDGPRAIDDISRAMARSPYDPLFYAYNSVAGMAYLSDGQYERAVEFGLRSIYENKSYTSAYRLLVIALVLAERDEEAKVQAHQLLKMEPTLTVERFRNRYPGNASAHADMYCEALATAGIPLE